MTRADLNPDLGQSQFAQNGNSTAAHAQPDQVDSNSAPLITIFSIPKPFDNTQHGTDQIQQNAINSWTRLGPDVEVLLIGDEDGIAQTAAELEVRHSDGLEFNQHGTPLVSSAFQIAHQKTRSPILVYCNCDVILMPDFVDAIKTLVADQTCSQFVAFGQRTDLKVDHVVDFDDVGQTQQLLEDCDRDGTPVSNACKEYFAFNRELYTNVPRFAVGRGNWDNWMIHFAKQQNIAVVSLSDLVRVVHQEHDYSHMKAQRFQCYVSGDEAKENRRLAGGRHLISGSTPSWRLTRDGLVRENPFLLSRNFWADVPRFARLMLNLLGR